MSESEPSKLERRCGFTILLLSAILCAVTTACFAGAWDPVTAVTTLPQWSWAFAGILGAVIAWRLLGRISVLAPALLSLWLLTTALFADNLVPVLRGIGRGFRPVTLAPNGMLRVVTLNCASSSLAAEETMNFKPDIILLQESPTTNEVARLAREWFGDNSAFIAGFDCSIVSRFPLRVIEERRSVHHTRAIVVLPGNRDVLVTSLRLDPPLGRIDVWNPSIWRAYLEDRRRRKRELQSALQTDSVKSDVPRIIGGDFNAPASDGIYKLLENFRDAHRIAGRRWGNTALNTLPLFRPDQIWLKGLMPTSSYAVRTTNSDHRMVVADILVIQ